MRRVWEVIALHKSDRLIINIDPSKADSPDEAIEAAIKKARLERGFWNFYVRMVEDVV